MFRVCHAFLSVQCSLLVTCLERANLLALLCGVFCHLPVWCPGSVWFLIVSIPDLASLLVYNLRACIFLPALLKISCCQSFFLPRNNNRNHSKTFIGDGLL